MPPFLAWRSGMRPLRIPAAGASRRCPASPAWRCCVRRSLRIGECRHRALDAVFAQQVQGREGRAVGAVADVVGRGAGELVVGMEAGDLDLAFQSERRDQPVGAGRGNRCSRGNRRAPADARSAWCRSAPDRLRAAARSSSRSCSSSASGVAPRSARSAPAAWRRPPWRTGTGSARSPRARASGG